jgi:hypothetical protein
MRFEKLHYGKIHSLLIIRHQGQLKFKVGDQIFKSPTAAAKHIIGDRAGEVSGPAFWRFKPQ